MTYPLSILNLLLDLEERNATHISLVSGNQGFPLAHHLGLVSVGPTGFVALTVKGLDVLMGKNQWDLQEIQEAA